MTDPDDTVRLELVELVDPNPTAYVERYRPPVPPPVDRLDLVRHPCRYCGSTSATAHVYGERKCCPDCDHRPETTGV